ncbi:MAG TPA: DUF2723 domain-containing protein [Candidatus Limnocylindrales bacterium]|nr:DUF2723 domain-containing protein [Candidatus Limnocylindrales bacterium]
MPVRRSVVLTVAIAFAVPLVVLLASVRTSVGFWDIGDLQTVAWIAGIPYPTGFPGYVMLSWLWTHLLPFGSVAARVNALSAVAIAGASGALAALALELDVLPVVAVLGAWTFAFARAVWLRATYADVHPLGFAVALVALVMAVRWALHGDRRALAIGIVLAGAAVAIDNTTVLILLGGVVATLARPWPAGLVARCVAVAAVIVVAAYAYLPLRSAYVTAHRADPTLALGIEPGRPFWDDHHPSTPDGFRSLTAGTEWNAGGSVLRVFTPDAVVAAVQRFGPGLLEDAPQGLLAAALIGLALAFARAPVALTGLIVAAAVPALFGASYPAEADPGRYAFMLYAAVALGAAVAADRTIRAFGRERPGVALGAVCGLLALVLIYDASRGREVLALRGNAEAAELGERVAASTRDGAVVVAPWDFATPLAYRAYVERGLGGRIVVCALPHDHLDEYRAWMRARQVAIVSDGVPDLPGYRIRTLSGGSPQVYEILAR